MWADIVYACQSFQANGLVIKGDYLLLLTGFSHVLREPPSIPSAGYWLFVVNINLQVIRYIYYKINFAANLIALFIVQYFENVI